MAGISISTASAAPEGLPQRIANSFRGMFDGYAAYRRYVALSSMSESALGSIGLTRLDVPRAAMFPKEFVSRQSPKSRPGAMAAGVILHIGVDADRAAFWRSVKAAKRALCQSRVAPVAGA